VAIDRLKRKQEKAKARGKKPQAPSNVVPIDRKAAFKAKMKANLAASMSAGQSYADLLPEGW
jgi:hypothetical protein